MDIKDWVQDLSAKQKQHLEKVFDEYDEDKSGTIDTQELKELFIESGFSFNDTQFKHIQHFADVDGNGTLDKREFMAICAFLNTVQDLFDEFKKEEHDPAYVPFTRLRKVLRRASYEFTNKQLRLCRALCDTDKNGRLEVEELLELFIYLKWLQVAFERADKDNSNTISMDEALDAVSFLGHKVDPAKAKRLFAKVDTDGNNSMCFGEFFHFTVVAGLDVRNQSYEDDGVEVNFDE